MPKPSPLTPAELEAIRCPDYFECTSFVAKRGGQPERHRFDTKAGAIKFKMMHPRYLLFVVGKNGMRVIQTIADLKKGTLDERH